jgi:hypothetical protein
MIREHARITKLVHYHRVIPGAKPKNPNAPEEMLSVVRHSIHTVDVDITTSTNVVSVIFAPVLTDWYIPTQLIYKYLGTQPLVRALSLHVIPVDLPYAIALFLLDYVSFVLGSINDNKTACCAAYQHHVGLAP